MLFLFAVAASLIEGRLLAHIVFDGAEDALADRVVLWAAAALGFFLLVPLAAAFAVGVSLAWTCGAHAVVVAAMAPAAIRAGRRRNPDAWKWNALFGGGWLAEWRQVALAAPRSSIALWVVVTSWWAAMAVPGWFLPPRAFDAVDYHVLQQAAQWRGDGGFHFLLGTDERADPLMARGQTSPNAKMMFGLLLAEARGSWRGAGMVQWLFLGVWLLTAWALARRMGLPAWCGAAGALFLASIPEVMLQATESYADVQAAAGAGLVFWALTGLREESRPERWIVPAALGFGHFVGAKLSVLPAAAGLGLAGLVVAAGRGGASRVQLPLRLLAASLVSGMLFAGPWILAAVLLYGNPIFPFKVTVLGTELLPGVFGPEVTAATLANATGVRVPGAYWHNAMESGGVTLLSGWLSGIGPQWTVLGLPSFAAMAIFGWGDASRRWRLPVVLAGIVFLLSPHLWYARFALQLGSVLALALGRSLAGGPAWLRGGMMTVLLACAGWNAVRVVPAWQYRPRTPVVAAYPLVTGDTAPVLLERLPGVLTARDVARDVLSGRPDVRVALSVPGLTITRLVGDDLRLNAEAVAPPTPDAPVGEWLQALRRRGFTHLLAPAAGPEASALGPPLFEENPPVAEDAWGPVAPPREALWLLEVQP